MVATLGALCALAMILSYIESLIPAFVAIPGVKIGLANTVTLFAIYFLGRRYAIGISLVRVLLSSLLFGSAVSLVYSLSGALLSFAGMALLSRLPIFSPIGVSAAGGVLHNIGQIIAAFFMLGTGGVLYYLPMLLISGVVSGVVIGVLAGIVLVRMKKIL